jgi:hypothetical protein
MYVAEAQVTHHQSASISNLPAPQRGMMFFMSEMRYLRKHWSMPKYAFVRLAAAFVLLLDIPLLILKKWLGRASQTEWNAWVGFYLPMLRAFLVEWE